MSAARLMAEARPDGPPLLACIRVRVRVRVGVRAGVRDRIRVS